MDGAAGPGLDIISGNVVDDRKVVFGINRNAACAASCRRACPMTTR